MSECLHLLQIFKMILRCSADIICSGLASMEYSRWGVSGDATRSKHDGSISSVASGLNPARSAELILWNAGRWLSSIVPIEAIEFASKFIERDGWFWVMTQPHLEKLRSALDRPPIGLLPKKCLCDFPNGYV